ncbi:MAG: glycoside hydrolase family 5 [bacterium]|nr:MAG: glycoside hydrolase family 5 [bacterium]
MATGTYVYKVQPRDNALNEQATGNGTKTVKVDRAAPNVVTQLNGPAYTNTSVVLTWTAPPDVGPAGVKDYHVFRDTTDLGYVTVTTLTDAGVTTGTYVYKVQPRDNALNERSSGNDTLSVMFEQTPPPMVSVTSANTHDNGGATHVCLDWSTVVDSGATVSGVGYYRIYLSTTTSKPASASATAAAPTVSVDFGPNTANVWINAVDRAGNEGPTNGPAAVTINSNCAP